MQLLEGDIDHTLKTASVLDTIQPPHHDGCHDYTERHRGEADMSDTAEATHTSQPGMTSGGTSAKGFTWRIVAYCEEHGIPLSGSKADRLGVRMKRRAERMQEEFDFYEGLRVLGIFKDETARDAIRNMERGQQCQ